MAAGLRPPFSVRSAHNSRKHKAESNDGQHNGCTLEKVFHTFTTF